ncbi:MAG: UvrD-helicase domain-containing protein [Holophagales bacterium]|nr:UvrD-helicase domain-containing protein [Holophagales bacterium]
MKNLTFSDPNLIGHSVAVSASAGSGKTFTLTVLVLLALGRMEARAFEIFATTFSEAAAADLRERLLRPLDLLASLEPDFWGRLLPVSADLSDVLASLDVSPRLSKSAAELAEAIPHFGPQPWMDSPSLAQTFWRRTRREAELMQVSTLHSFALGLLRTGNGVPDRILEADHPALLRVLRHATREIADIPETHTDHTAARALLMWAEANWSEVSADYDAHRDALGQVNFEKVNCSKAQNASVQYNTDNKLQSEIILEEESSAELKASLESARKAIGRFFNDPGAAKDSNSKTIRYFDAKKILPPPESNSSLKAQIRWAERQSAVLGHSADSLPGYYSAEFVQAIQTLAPVASAWEARLRAILAKSLTRFEKLKLSRGMATFGDIVRSALEGLEDGTIKPPCPKLLLVDEYQDTSQAQDAFLGALKAERIVRVGDIKQAIYGFRGGSPDLLQAHIEAAGDCAYRLPVNFRSAPPIVDMANAFVSKIWSENAAIEHTEANQLPRAQGDCPVGAVMAAGPSIGTDLPALSQWIAALSHESGWEDALGGTSIPGSQPTRALLLRQRTKLPTLLIRLKKHGIQPYVLAKEGFWDSPGTRLVMMALEAFAYPNRSLPCAVLMRHFVGLSDSELHQIGEIKGIGYIKPEDIPVKKRSYAVWLQSLMSATTQQIAAALLAQGNLLSIIASLDVHGAMEPDRARRNLAGFLAMLQDYPASPVAAFALLDELRNGPERGDLPSVSRDADLIIQTAHGSKGLEYDNVILPLLNNRKTGVKKGHILTNPATKQLMFAWKLGNELGSDYRLIKDLTDLRQRRDDLNLLYVALTRAKKRLCLLIQAPEKPKKAVKQTETPNNSWARLGSELLKHHGKLLELSDPPPMPPQNKYQRPVLEKPLNKTESSLYQLIPAPHDHHSQIENLRLRREGEAMHTYLQNLLVRWEDTESFNHVLNNPPPVHNAKENAMRFLDVFESRGWRYLRRRTEMRLQGASPYGTGGRADLVVWDRDCIHIIDFKNTHELTAESKDTYTQQLNRYASALNAQNASVKGWLALLKSGAWIEIL